VVHEPKVSCNGLFFTFGERRLSLLNPWAYIPCPWGLIDAPCGVREASLLYLKSIAGLFESFALRALASAFKLS